MRVFISIFIGFIFIVQHSISYAGFYFGDLTEDGRGSFNQLIPLKKVTRVPGVIPKGVKNLKIDLKSLKDLDVRLYDPDANNKAIVGWNIGALIGDSSNFSEVYYKGVTIKYSGFNGDCPSFNGNYNSCSNNTSPGNEYIHITGTTSNRFVMHAYGYDEGTAKINFSWKGSIQEIGTGEFSSPVKKNGRVELEGSLPKGLDNLTITLSSNADIDIELYDFETGDFVVGWKNNELNGQPDRNDGKKAIIFSDREITKIYKNDKITWSGWNGRYTETKESTFGSYNPEAEKGNEYIRIHGKSKNKYIMKVYGYNNGNALVNYRWGNNIIFTSILGQTNMIDSENDDTIKIYTASNGTLPSYIKKVNPSLSGLSGYNSTHYNYVAKEINGLPAITIIISALNYAGGDILLSDSGNSQYVFNYIRSLILNNNKNKIYLTGHSSGGGDIQNLMWKFNDIFYHRIEKTFQIDSAEIFSGDSKIPPNVKEAFNFYQNEDTASLATEHNIVAEDSNSTIIHNKQIVNPTRGVENDSQTPHQRIDNDPRVWKKIVTELFNVPL